MCCSLPSAHAATQVLCTGYASCHARGYQHYGYAEQSKSMYWRMYRGHNCTNYVAYRLVQNGMPNVRPYAKLGNAAGWGKVAKKLTNSKPNLGAVAWWKSGHVAIVEKVVSPTEILVSEDNWGGDFRWRRITKSAKGWPTGFIHFLDQGNGSPIGVVESATSPGKGKITVNGWSYDPDVPMKSTQIRVYVGGPAGSPLRYTGEANLTRTDLPSGAAGPKHGFSTTVDIKKGGTYGVYVYGINAGGTPGTWALLGWQKVKVAAP